MKDMFFSVKCAECGITKKLLDVDNYAYKIGTKKYCCYSCYMKAFKRKYAKEYNNVKYLQKLNELDLC